MKWYVADYSRPDGPFIRWFVEGQDVEDDRRSLADAFGDVVMHFNGRILELLPRVPEETAEAIAELLMQISKADRYMIDENDGVWVGEAPTYRE